MVLLTAVFNNIDRTIVSILVRPIKEEFHLNDTQWVSAHGAFAIVYVVLVLPIGRYADTVGVRRNIIAGSLRVEPVHGRDRLGDFAPPARAGADGRRGRRGGRDRAVGLDAGRLSPAGASRGRDVRDLDGGGDRHGPRHGRRRLDQREPTAGEPPSSQRGPRDPARPRVPRDLFGSRCAAGARGDGLRKPEPSSRACARCFATRTYLFILAANAFTLFASMGRNLWEPQFLVRSYEMGEFHAARGTS